MYHNLKNLLGKAVHATDGEIGRVDDFYFDDDQWAIRYLVLETGSWLDNKKILIATDALQPPADQIFPVNLSREQVKNSPDIDSNRPVSRQDEAVLRSYYGWPPYWNTGAGPMGGVGMPAWPAVPVPVPVTGSEGGEGVEDAPRDDQRQDPHLRSFNEVAGYRLNADDGEIGKMVDLIVDQERWNVLYMIVDTGGLFPGKKVLVSPNWVEQISAASREVDVDLKVETIRKSPEWDPDHPLDRDYEERLHEHYGRRGYWEG